MKAQIRKSIFLVFGWIFVILGFIGALLPVIPTTPFLLLAAYFFAEGSPKFYHWLINLPHFGEKIRAWHEHGVIDRTAKWGSLLAILMVVASFFYFGNYPTYVGVILISTLTLVLIFIFTRPESPRIDPQ